MLNLTKKKPAVETSAPAAAQPQTSAKPPFSTAKAAPKLAFMKTGAQAKQAIADADAKAELAMQERGKMFRWWLEPEGEGRLTFLDGELDDDGMLATGVFYEHQVMVGGEREHFICTSSMDESTPCPICEKGESRPYLIGAMTVCDHRQYTVKQGKNAGKVYQHTRKLFVPKKESLKQLTKLAVKRGGLTGCTFDVSRGNEKTAAVGTQFDFVEKNTIPELAAKLNLKVEDLAPADYEKEFTFRSAEELIKLGLGKAPGGIGYEKGVSSGKDLKSQL